MSWTSIVIGVEASAAARSAVELGRAVARASGADWSVVHAVPDRRPTFREPALDMDRGRQALTVLQSRLPPEAYGRLEMRVGNPESVLAHLAAERGAELIVLGGKRRPAIARWVAGGTVRRLARIVDVPLLIARGEGHPITRVLVAVDQSPAAHVTFGAAARVAALFGATLRVLHVTESHESRAVDMLDQFRDVTAPRSVELVCRQRRPTRAIAAETAAWTPDLLVLGSHGRGVRDRIILGHVAEYFLDQLPAALLLVPTAVPALLELSAPAGGASPSPGLIGAV